MTSTQEQPLPQKAPDYGRRIQWLGLAFLIATGVWSAAWYGLAEKGKSVVDAAVADAAAEGRTLACGNRAVRGYPFRFGLFCDAVSYQSADEGVSLSAGAFRSAAQAYNPWHVVAELDGPARIEAPGVRPLAVNWSLAHASARLGDPLPKRADIEVRDLDVTVTGDTGSGARTVVAALASAHLLQTDNDLALAADASDLHVDPSLTPGRTVPPLSVALDGLIKDGVAIAARKPSSVSDALRGASGEIANAEVTFKDGGALSLSGPVSFDAAGLMTADLTISLVDADRLGAALAKALPEAASAIQPALAAAAMTAGKDGKSSLVVTVRAGKASIGFIPLGSIAPLP